MDVWGNIAISGSGDINIYFTRGGTLVNTVDFISAINAPVWSATWPCKVIKIKGYRVGGDTNTKINARKNGSINHLSSDLALPSASVWIDAGSVQNTDYAVGDSLEIMVTTAGASLTQIAVQVDFIKLLT